MLNDLHVNWDDPSAHMFAKRGAKSFDPDITGR
jgi:hypothetical protein